MSETIEMMYGLMILAPIILSAMMYKSYAMYIVRTAEGYNPHTRLPRYISLLSVLSLLAMDYLGSLSLVISLALLGVLVFMHSKRVEIKHAVLFSVVQVFAAIVQTFMFIVKLAASFIFKTNMQSSNNTEAFLESYANERKAASKAIRDEEEDRELGERWTAHKHGVSVEDAKNMGIINPEE